MQLFGLVNQHEQDQVQHDNEEVKEEEHGEDPTLVGFHDGVGCHRERQHRGVVHAPAHLWKQRDERTLTSF